jgi:hypothetical protein
MMVESRSADHPRLAGMAAQHGRTPDRALAPAHSGGKRHRFRQVLSPPLDQRAIAVDPICGVLARTRQVSRQTALALPRSPVPEKYHRP